MGKKSFVAFSDDETRRRLRHWFVSHPQATEADIPEALTVLDRPGLHDWITLGRTVARAIGKRLGADTSEEVRVTLFGNLQPDLVDDFVTGEYWAALDSARLVRNERSHGGIESEASLADRLARFEAALNDLRLQASHPFASADLIRPGPAERGIDDLYTFDRAERLMGSNTTFDEREVKSTASMRGPGLYLVPAAGDVERPLHLLPLIAFTTSQGPTSARSSTTTAVPKPPATTNSASSPTTSTPTPRNTCRTSPSQG
jgi:hypothetical protein